MNSITHNPFRILGVFANDPFKARTANISRIRAFNKVGKECEFESDIKAVFGNIDRSEEAVEQAISLLSSESEAEFYSCLWIHRTQRINKTAKAPIDIIQSGIGSKDKSDIVNVLVGAILADNIQLSAEYLVKLFECNDTLLDSVKERLIVTLGDNFIDDNSSLFPIVWWSQLRDYCNNGDGHDDSLSFIARVFNKESMNYIRRVTEAIEKENDTKVSTWSVFLNGTRPIIEIIKETSNLHSKEPNAEAQIVLSEYAAASLSASKKYYENNRFWDASPIESLLDKLREIYKISYSSKTKEECTEFGKKVKNELPYLAPSDVKSSSATIRKEVEYFCTKPNETRWALQLLKNCIPALVEIKSVLGTNNLYYRRISTQIADNSIYASTSEIDSAVRKYNNPDNNYLIAKANLSQVLSQAAKLHINLTQLDLERDFIDNKLNKFNEKINSCSKRYGIIVETPIPNISLETEDDTYNQCNDYLSLVEYVQSHPDSPRIQEAIQRIWKMEDAGFPQLGTSMPAYCKALLAYKEKYPNSHNEQKLIKEIDEALLGRAAMGTVSDYRAMLRLWPNHPKRAIILGRLELATFKLCHDVDGWKNYLKEYPNGQYSDEAKLLIKKAEEEIETDEFNKCVSIADLNRFIFKYPKSPLADEAIGKIEDKVYSQALQSGNFDAYFKQYPNGRHTEKLNKLLDDQYYKKCTTKKDFEKYLQKYPQGQHSAQARAFIRKENRRKLFFVLFIIASLVGIGAIIIANINKTPSTPSSIPQTNYLVDESRDGSSDKRDELYRNLINSGKVTEAEIGSIDDFKRAVYDKASAQYFYYKLMSTGLFTEAELGDAETFYQSIQSDFDAVSTTNQDKVPSSSETYSNYDNSRYKSNPDAEYLNNSLETGDKPYSEYFGEEWTGHNYFYFKTSGKSDFIVIVKGHYDDMYINHIYIRGGDNAYLYVPDGTFDVYFYSGEGWNPNKKVGHFTGGFVSGLMQMDGPVELESAYMEYTLYPVKHGNLRLQGADMNDVFN